MEPIRARSRRADVPVLVLQGQCDYMAYAATYEYVDLFPDAEYRFVEDAGHIIWWDRPDAYVEAIAAFLLQGGVRRTVAPARPTG